MGYSQRPEKVLRATPILLVKRDDVVQQALPVLFTPRVMPLEERDQKLVTRMENLPDCFYVRIHLV